MANKNRLPTSVRLTAENAKRISDYKRREPFSPNITTIVNFALQKFLESQLPESLVESKSNR